MKSDRNSALIPFDIRADTERGGPRLVTAPAGGVESAIGGLRGGRDSPLAVF